MQRHVFVYHLYHQTQQFFKTYNDTTAWLQYTQQSLMEGYWQWSQSVFLFSFFMWTNTDCETRNRCVPAASTLSISWQFNSQTLKYDMGNCLTTMVLILTGYDYWPPVPRGSSPITDLAPRRKLCVRKGNYFLAVWNWWPKYPLFVVLVISCSNITSFINDHLDAEDYRHVRAWLYILNSIKPVC